MDACYLTSSSLTKNIEIPNLLRVQRPTTHTRRNSKKHQIRKPGDSASVACCQSSPSSADEEGPLLSTDWRAFRAKLVAKERVLRPESLPLIINPDAPPTQPITIGDKWVHPIHEPEKGSLLIATEKLDGVHIFERTVILILSTGHIGPTGLILNRSSLMSIKETRSSAMDASGLFSNMPLFFGGPIEGGVFLVNPKNRYNDRVRNSGMFEEVMNGVYYGTKECVGRAAQMVKRDLVQVEDFRFFDGCCAWDRRLLREEIRAGYWTLAACSPGIIGPNGLENIGLWEEIMGLLGQRRVW